MNTPPTDGMRLKAQHLQDLVRDIFAAVPVPAQDATLIAELLVDTELRGVVSHGVVQVERYVRAFIDGTANPNPDIRTLEEGPTTTALAGDGGLGIVVGTRAMRLGIDKAAEYGLGASTTTYHDHIGSAGKYIRMAMQRDMIGICFSGRNAAPHYDPQSPVQSSIQGSPPLAFGAPSGPKQPDFALDMASHMPWDEQTFARMPQVYFKALGFSHLANILSGTLGGQMLPEFDRRNIRYHTANQSAFFMAIDISRFVGPDAFKADMDHLMDGVGGMQPFPGCDEAALPGGPEWKRKKEYTRDGIPVSVATIDGLKRVAAELGVTTPWE
jgi:LDH2 family malate/lactate/ureidoglycolate dehydrogenase